MVTSPNDLSPFALEGRVALVTGAGAGVGRGIVMALAAAGAHVVVTGRRPEVLAGVVADVVDSGGSAEALRCDVTNAEEISAAVAQPPCLDIVVHNAVSERGSEPHRVEEIDEALWESNVAVSIRATRMLAEAARARPAERGVGRFIVLTSTAGFEGSANLPTYAATKAAQRGYVEALARTWGPDAITVNCIAPLAVTPALERAMDANPQLEPRLAGRIALGRLGDPEADIGPTAVFLASDAGAYITGRTLIVDGGSFTTT